MIEKQRAPTTAATTQHSNNPLQDDNKQSNLYSVFHNEWGWSFWTATLKVEKCFQNKTRRNEKRSQNQSSNILFIKCALARLTVKMVSYAFFVASKQIHTNETMNAFEYEYARQTCSTTAWCRFSLASRFSISM